MKRPTYNRSTSIQVAVRFPVETYHFIKKRKPKREKFTTKLLALLRDIQAQEDKDGPR